MNNENKEDELPEEYSQFYINDMWEKMYRHHPYMNYEERKYYYNKHFPYLTDEEILQDHIKYNGVDWKEKEEKMFKCDGILQIKNNKIK